jgi:hypothetical protein
MRNQAEAELTSQKKPLASRAVEKPQTTPREGTRPTTVLQRSNDDVDGPLPPAGEFFSSLLRYDRY